MNLQKTSITLLMIFVLSACSAVIVETPVPNPSSHPPNSTPTEVTPSTTFPEAVQAVQKAIAEQFGFAPETIEMVGFENTQWPDSCLGWANVDEVCLQAITPGYAGTARSDKQEFLFRTNDDGSVVRIIPAAAMSALQQLAQQAAAEPAAIHFINIEVVEWPDSCLGGQLVDQMCAEVITPGYRVLLQLDGQEYEFHTNLVGDQVVKYQLPSSNHEEIQLLWLQDDQSECPSVMFYTQEVIWNECAGEKQSSSYSTQLQFDEFIHFASMFAPFQAKTPAGIVDFIGNGKITATVSQQRMLAEWARLAYLEKQIGSSSIEQGAILSYYIEGGIAGRCEEVKVFMSGYATVTSCPGTFPERFGVVWLSDHQLADLYQYADELRSYEIQQTDLGAADALTTEILFSGKGAMVASPVEQQSIANMAEEFITQVTLKPEAASIEEARQALVKYFNALNVADYAEAANLYGGDYQVFRDNNPDIPGDNYAGLFEAGCTVNGYLCNLAIRNEVHVAAISNDQFRFSVELQNPDGSLFILGPCCGASEEEFPSISQFDFIVKQSNQGFVILTLPVYVP